jgi:multiple sugar transport system permease protein
MASIFGIFLVRQYALSIPTTSSTPHASTAPASPHLPRHRRAAAQADHRHALPCSRCSAPGTISCGRSSCCRTRPLHLPVALASLSREHVADNELMMAGSGRDDAAGAGVFIALQRYYLQGLMAGSVKA